jgi:hypothetical protein
MSIGGKSKKVDDGGSAKIRDSAAKVGDEAGRAALDTASDLSDFTQKFHDDYIAPSLAKLSTATDEAQAANKALLANQQSVAGKTQGLYEDKGLAAQKEFFDRAASFDDKAEGERYAGLAIGDLKNQRVNVEAQMGRRAGAAGVNPTSGAGMAGMREAATGFSLAEAKAANVARLQQLLRKDQMVAGAANAGAALGSQSSQMLAAQNATIGQGAGLPMAQLGAQTEAYKPMYSGYMGAGGIQSDMYKSSLGGQTASAANITNASIQDSKNAAESNSGMGKLAGIALKAGLTYAFPPAGIALAATEAAG